MTSISEMKVPVDELVNGIKSGDHVAFTRLYREFAGFAYAILRRHLGLSHHLEDLLQQVFLKVYRETPEFRGDRPFRAWLRRACYFVIYDHIRSVKKTTFESLDAIDSDNIIYKQALIDDRKTDNPEHSLMEVETLKRLHVILNKLSPEKRMALVMHDFEGHTMGEVAEILECSKFTVRTRLVRARREFANKAKKDKALMQCLGRSVA
ncbi:MAG: RNA polymerase sigma factor [Proteobacteria bacterium]|nr:RNA polymerase sigma factor [Pseudomonadota bacterium]